MPIKDHATLLRVIERLPGVHLAVIGDGEMRGPIDAESATRGLTDRVHFVGWRHDLPRSSGTSMPWSLTSRNEGTPVALVESLAAGRPVVATDVGGVGHVVAKDGTTGLLRPPAMSGPIAARVSTVLSDPALAVRLAQAGRPAVAPALRRRPPDQRDARLYREPVTTLRHRG